MAASVVRLVLRVARERAVGSREKRRSAERMTKRDRLPAHYTAATTALLTVV